MNMRNGVLAALVGFSIFSFNCNGDDWPGFRGIHRDAISKETGLAKQWPEAGPKLVWQNKGVSEGWGAPAVAGDTVYLLGSKGVEEESISAYKVADGVKIWSTKIGGVGKPNQQPKYPGARSTPTIDHGVAFVMGSDGDVAAVDTKNGEIKWHKNVRTDFGGESGIWAYAESPLVDGDNVVVSPGKEKATVVALNKNSGAEVWRCAIPEGDVAAYGSTIVVDFGGIREYVAVLQNGMVGIDAHTGKLLWRYAHAGKGSPAYIPTPVEKDGIIYTAGARVGSGAVKLKVVEGDKVSFEELYFDNKLPAAIGGSLVVGDTLYGTGGGGLQAVDFATGKVKWQDKSVGPASLLFADGNLILHSEEGQIALVAANSEKYEEKGHFTPKDAPARTAGAKSWAYPAVANGQLYLHEGNSLWRYDLK